MTITFRRLKTAAVAVLLAPMAAALATPAHAGGLCSGTQDKSISTPGYNTDLHVQICSTGGTSRHHGAYFVVTWNDGGDSAVDGDRKFDGLHFHLRVERYNNTYVKDWWSLAGLVNRNESGSWSSPILEATSTLRGGWTGDGFVSYNIDRDGKGYIEPHWSLHGSTMVY